MCGRARCTLRPDDFPRACHLNSRPVRHLNMDRYRPSYNMAPGFNVPVVRRDENGVVLHCMKWGLVPSFTKKNEKPDHFKMFNARSESIREKASFRRLLPNNRCLVSVEGFYEWKKDGSKKQPYYIHLKDGRPLVFAALYDSWKNSEGEIIYTFTIITTSSSSSLNWLHDRMPIILGDQESADRWLIDSSMSNLDKFLKPYEEADLVWYPVTSEMGKPSFDGPECINEIQVKREGTRPISQFFSKKGPLQKPKLENTTTDTVVKQELKSVEEAENQVVKEKPQINQEDQLQLPPPKDDNHKKSDVSLSPEKGHGITMKRDFEDFDGAGDNPSPKKVMVEPTIPSPILKRGKVATDKQQPTLFSYFGRS